MLAVSTSEGLTLLDPASIQDTSIKVPCPPITALAMSPDGKVLCGVYESVIIMQMSEDRGMKELYKHNQGAQGEITAIAMLEGGLEVLFAQGSKVYTYDVLSGRLSGNVLDGHRSSARIRSLSLSPSSTHVASVTSSSILIHSLSTPASRISIKAPSSSPFTTATFSPFHRTTLVSGHKDGLVLVWDTLHPSVPLRQIQAAKGAIVDICYAPPNKSGKTLYAVASQEGEVVVLDPEDDKDPPFRMSIRGSVGLTSVAFLPSGMTLIAGTEDGRVIQHELKTFGKSQTSITLDTRKGKILAIAAAPGKPDKMSQVALASLQGKRTTPLAERPVNASPSPPAPRRERKSSVVKASSPPKRTSAGGKNADAGQTAVGRMGQVENSSKPDQVVWKTSSTDRPAGPPSRTTSQAQIHNAAKSRRTSTSTVKPSGAVNTRSSFGDIDPPSSKPTPSVLERAAPGTSKDTGRSKQAAAKVDPLWKPTPLAEHAVSKPPSESARAKPPAVPSSRGEAGPSRSSEATSRPNEHTRRPSERRVVLHTPTPDPGSPPEPTPAPAHERFSLATAASTSLALVPSPRKPSPHIQHAIPPGILDQVQQGTSTGAGAEIVRALLDWRAETARATRNLHLDVLRTARMQKEDIRRMMQEMRDEIGELRRDNERLRAENERLRRGF